MLLRHDWAGKLSSIRSWIRMIQTILRKALHETHKTSLFRWWKFTLRNIFRRISNRTGELPWYGYIDGSF